MPDLFEKFQALGHKASYHYADDSTKEWVFGDKAKYEALELFDNATPSLQKQMRDIAKGFLWSLTMERPE